MKQNQTSVLRRLHLAAILCCIFLIVEVIGGTWSGSLAVLSDAAHLVADLTSFGVAILAGHLAQLPSSDQHTYGLRRTESLAALLSMVSLALVSLGLAWEAVRRLFFVGDRDVDGPLMSLIALIGVLVNIILAVVLGEHHVHLPGYSSSCSHDHAHNHHGAEDHHEDSSSHSPQDHHHSHKGNHTSQDHHDHEHHHHHHHDESSLHKCNHEHHAPPDALEAGHSHQHHNNNHETTPLIPDHYHEAVPERTEENVNLRAAYLHVMGDLAQSVAVLIAGVIIYFQPTWTIVDPIATLLFCTMVFASTLPVIRRGVAVLLEEVPPHISWKQVHDALEQVPHISNVHDLHIWSISDGRPGLTVHCSVEADRATQALQDVQRVCRSFGIAHTTIQMQEDGGECITCAGDNYLCARRE